MNYTLKKGKYSSGLHFGVHFGIKSKSFKVKFSKECVYQPLNWENDYNKLLGWSYGFLPKRHEVGFSSSPDFRLFGKDYVWAHHYNSVRVCWRPYVPNTDNPDYYMPNKLELVIYVYDRGLRKLSTSTWIVEPEKEYVFDLTTDDTKSIFSEDNCKVRLIKDSAVDPVTLWTSFTNIMQKGYRLFPVFGGNDRAPHDMKIQLNIL